MYLYYAIFILADDGNLHVSFPDLIDADTYGQSMHEALYMAKDMLAGWLMNAEDRGIAIPQPSDPQDIEVLEGNLLIPVEVNLMIAREKINNHLINQTVTIPKYLYLLARHEGIDLSKILTTTLKDALEI